MPNVQPFTTGQLLALERELIGLYLSGHPLDDYKAILDALPLDRIVDLAEAPEGGHALAAGMVVSLKPFTTRKGQAMAFLEVEDRIMRVEAVGFPTVWKRHAALLSPGSLVILQATVQHQDDDFKLIIEDVIPLDRADQDLAEQVRRLERQARARTPRAAAPAPAAQAAPRGGGPASRPAAPLAAAPQAPGAAGAARSQRLRGSAAAQRLRRQ